MVHKATDIPVTELMKMSKGELESWLQAAEMAAVAMMPDPGE